MSVLCFEAPGDVSLDQLEDELTRAFLVVRAALDRGDAAVVVVADRDIQGLGSVAGAALAHGLLGLVRTFGIEGRKPGWHVNILAVSDAVSSEERAEWIDRLSRPQGATGALIRLGDEHLGRVPA